MHEYELIYIQRSGVTDDKTQKLAARISKAFEKQGGSVLSERDLGEKSLAYLILKERKGVYRQINFLGNGALVDEIESQLKIAPEVLRFLTVCLGHNVDPEQKKQEYAQAAAAQTQEAPRADTEPVSS